MTTREYMQAGLFGLALWGFVFLALWSLTP